MSQLLTAWLSWCGGVTFTLMFVFLAMYFTSNHAHSRQRSTLIFALVFALVTAGLAAVQVTRLA